MFASGSPFEMLTDECNHVHRPAQVRQGQAMRGSCLCVCVGGGCGGGGRVCGAHVRVLVCGGGGQVSPVCGEGLLGGWLAGA